MLRKSLIEMTSYLIQVGYHPDDLAGYSSKEIRKSYKEETSPNRSKDITITLTREQWKQLEKQANAEDYTIQSFIQDLVASSLD
jgi:hypothetical protein